MKTLKEFEFLAHKFKVGSVKRLSVEIRKTPGIFIQRLNSINLIKMSLTFSSLSSITKNKTSINPIFLL